MGLDDKRIKKETEGLITATQDQALRTNVVKAKIEKQQLSPLCRMCGVKDETVGHLLCECSKMAQMQYKNRHDVPSIVHWSISKQYGLMDLMSQRNGMSTRQNRLSKLLP